MPIGIGTAIMGAGALAAGASIYGATTAANAQSEAARNAIGAQQGMFATGKQALDPFIGAGRNAWDILGPMLGMQAPGGGPGILGGGATGPGTGEGARGIYGGAVAPGYGTLTTPFQPTMEQLEQTPGYQFTLGQGLKGVTNSAAAKGLGSSGAALKGAADYAGGLASSTFQQQHGNYLADTQSIYNMLYGPTQQGAGAAGALAGNATQAGAGIANSYGYMGNAQAAGANAIGTAAGQFGNSVTSAMLYAPLLQAQAQYYGNAAPGAAGAPNNALAPTGGGYPAGGTGAIPFPNYYQPFSFNP